MAFRVLIIGGTGQGGFAVVRALAAEPSCSEIVMVNRRAVSLNADARVRQVILNMADARFPTEVTELAQSTVAHGDPVYGASCVGVGKGSMRWSEGNLKPSKSAWSVASPAVVGPAVSRGFLCYRQWEATRQADFVTCGSWG